MSPLYLTSIPITHAKILETVPRWDDRLWMHKTIMKFFGQYDTSRGGTLFRFEPNYQRFLVQSKEPPTVQDGIQTKEISSRIENLIPHQKLFIKTELNPVKKRKNRKADQTGYFPVPEQELPVWVVNLFAKNGLAVAPVTLSFSSNVYRAKNFPLLVTQTEFTATVEDKEKFAESLHLGVGRSRAYGCGMISFLPLSPA